MTLTQLRDQLRKKVTDETLFSLLNTRVLLRTGVDLKEIRPGEDQDSDRLKKVQSVLDAMGYSVNGPAL